MKSVKNWLNKSDNLACAVLTALAIVLLIGLVGCTTVADKAPKASLASWDGTNQNSGVIGWQGNSLEITAHARARYNDLISIYSKRFQPPLVFDYGLIVAGSNTFLMTPEAIAQFSIMNRWHKQGINP